MTINKVSNSFRNSLLPHYHVFFPLLSSLMKRAPALLPLCVPSSPFASAHMGQAVMASSSLPHLPCHHHPPLRPPHHSPGLPPPFSTAASPQRQSPKACHPIDAPPLIEGCGHPDSPKAPLPRRWRRRRDIIINANANDDAMSAPIIGWTPR